ncbi:MAG: (4Fe-4S)-binding protein, partial [bacterium]
LEIGAALAPPVVEAVRAKEQGMGTVIIDAAPGTSCPVVAAIRDVDFCLLVTEPTPFGLHDLDLAARLVAELGVPAGVILNRAGEGDELVEEYCQRQGLPLLLKIPFSRNLAAIYAQGKVLVEELPQWREVFLNLGREIGRRVGR